MNKKDIGLLYEYNRWANGRIFDAVSKLTTEQFRQDLSSSHPSVRETLVHILWAEWLWLQRWRGTSPKTMFASDDFPDLSALRAKWAEVEQDQTDFLHRLTDEALETVITYTNLKEEEWTYSLQHMLQHLVNHSSYHRGQVTTMLRQLGAEVVETDFLWYIDVTPL